MTTQTLDSQTVSAQIKPVTVSVTIDGAKHLDEASIISVESAKKTVNVDGIDYEIDTLTLNDSNGTRFYFTTITGVEELQGFGKTLEAHFRGGHIESISIMLPESIFCRTSKSST